MKLRAAATSCGRALGRTLGQSAWLQSEASESRSVMSDSVRPRDSPGQNTEVGSRSLLQGVFPTQGSNPGLLHCRRDSLPAAPHGKQGRGGHQ